VALAPHSSVGSGPQHELSTAALPDGTRIPIESMDEVLAAHPFGDSDYITQQMHRSFMRRLSEIAENVEAAGVLLDALTASDNAKVRYRVLGDPVVRFSIKHMQTQPWRGEPFGLSARACGEIFEESARLVALGHDDSISAARGAPIGPDSHHARFWNEDDPDNSFRAAFRLAVHSNYPGALRSPTQGEVDTLRKAVGLLEEALPRCARSALSHTHVVAVFSPDDGWGGALSSSEFTVSGVIFLSETVLSDPWIAAEHLFHESLHQQLYDFRQAHSLLNRGTDRVALIHSLWNLPSEGNNDRWPAFRAIAAFHVYVHLSLLSQVARIRSGALKERYGPGKMVGPLTAAVRAHYLREQLRAECWTELGDGGKRIVEWFGAVLDALNPNLPAPGADVHLMLERYWRETTMLEAEDDDPADDLACKFFGALAETEMETTRSALVLAGVDPTKIDDSLQAGPVGEHFSGATRARFISTRKLIISALLDATLDDFTLAPSRAPDRLVKDMIECSSHLLVPYRSR
jgi:hypothetical protein